MSDLRDRLAREIREALGNADDPAAPIVLIVRGLVARIAELEAETDSYQRILIAEGDKVSGLKARIVELEARTIGLPPVHEPSEFVTAVDGYVYYWPHGSTGGHYAAHHLRRIATELDDRNREWHNQIMNDPVLGGGENDS